MIAALRDVSYSLGKPPSSEMESETGTVAARVLLTSNAAQQREEKTENRPLTRTVRQNAEGTVGRVSNRGAESAKVRALNLNRAALSTDRAIDEIRKALPPTPRRGLGRSEPRDSKARTSFLVVGFSMVVLLASWLVYRDRGLLWEVKERAMGGQDSPAPPQVPAPDPTSDPEPSEIPVPSLEPPSYSQAPSSTKQSLGLPLPVASDEVNASFLPQPAGGRSLSEKPRSASAASVGNQDSATLTEQAGSPRRSEISNSREAEVKERIAAGWFFIRRKDFRAAIETLTEALTIDPSNDEAHAALRLARFASQNPDMEVLPSDSQGTKDNDKGDTP
jgi:hypothetical protein